MRETIEGRIERLIPPSVTNAQYCGQSHDILLNYALAQNGHNGFPSKEDREFIAASIDTCLWRNKKTGDYFFVSMRVADRDQ